MHCRRAIPHLPSAAKPNGACAPDDGNSTVGRPRAFARSSVDSVVGALLVHADIRTLPLRGAALTFSGIRLSPNRKSSRFVWRALYSCRARQNWPQFSALRHLELNNFAPSSRRPSDPNADGEDHDRHWLREKAQPSASGESDSASISNRGSMLTAGMSRYGRSRGRSRHAHCAARSEPTS